MKQENTCIDIIGTARCTGCFGCESACSREAITILLDADGFYKPIVEHDKCNECGICQRYCPVITVQKNMLCAAEKYEPKAFAAWTNDEEVRMTSSSGGVFSELATMIIDSGGMVAGCVWGENWSPQHILTDLLSDVERMRGSKYVPSHLGTIYKKVLDVLHESDKQVLFSGTPCQVAAMDKVLSPEQRKRVLLMDFICHGVPSLRVFHRYLDELFDGDRVAEYTFRDKSFGWQTTIKAISANGKRHHLPAPSDAFFQGFVAHHLYVMEACYQCPFARLPRIGDITLGDFWGCPEKWYDKRGVSVVLINSPLGLKAIESIELSDRIVLKSIDVMTATDKNQRAISGSYYDMPNNRRLFLDALLKGEDFAKLQTRYFPTKWQLLFSAYQQSNSKVLFLAKLLYSRFHRFTQSAENS